MEITKNDTAGRERRIRIFRWYFYIALAQFLLYFIVPAVIFPARFIKDIEIISALTLGILVGFFFLLVNIVGFFMDRTRRVLYAPLISAVTVYFVWAIISWALIEKMEYLLR